MDALKYVFFWFEIGGGVERVLLPLVHLHLPDTARQGLCGAHLPRAQVPGNAGVETTRT